MYSKVYKKEIIIVSKIRQTLKTNILDFLSLVGARFYIKHKIYCPYVIHTHIYHMHTYI